MSDPWVCTFPVTAEVWADVDQLGREMLFDMARMNRPLGYRIVSEEARHVPASLDEYGEKPEHWVIVVRAVAENAEAPRPAEAERGAGPGGRLDDHG